MHNEQIIMGLIGNSGDARSKAFMALSALKEKDFEQAKSLLQEANNALLKAHKIQSELLWSEFNDKVEEKTEFSLLLIHAQDHFMTAMTVCELVEQFIDIFESLSEQNS